MTIRTGKGGRYRYYTCSIKARQGETGCKGMVDSDGEAGRSCRHHLRRASARSPSGWKTFWPAFSTAARSNPSAAAIISPN